MRLHQLTVRAFGPFADSVSLDFDELNTAGLFLLTGPTGAGKSSLLDAICFALYGTVPGARGTKALKSQHADPAVAPQVVLDFTVRERRFVVRRTPEWTRPKKRGAGEITEKASASLTELTTGSDHFLSARAAEVGHLVTDLMGMHASQFMQVALLPQGEFQTFLRANSQERHDVLQQLFRTDRFSRIEDWVHEHSRRLSNDARSGESTVQRLLDSIADRGDVELPSHLEGDELAGSAAAGRLLPWVDEATELARTELLAARGTQGQREQQVATARADHLDAQRRADLAGRLLTAEACLRDLQETAAEAVAAEQALTADRAAETLRPLLGLLDEAGAQLDLVREEHRGTMAALGDVTERQVTSDPETLAAEQTETRRQLARLEAVVSRAEAAELARRAAEEARRRLAAAEDSLVESRERLHALPGQIEKLSVHVADLAVKAGRAEAVTLTLATARARLAACTDLIALDREIGRLEELHRDAREAHLDAREHAQSLAERRVAGMAAELATGLEEGTACPVCGSEEHPAPAASSPGAVTPDDQSAAAAEVQHRGRAVERTAATLERTRLRREGLVAVAGDADLQAAAATVRDVEARLVVAETASRDHAEASDRLAALRDEQARLAQRQAAAATVTATLRQAAAGHDEVAGAAEEEVATALADQAVRGAGQDLQGRMAWLHDRAELLAAAEASLRSLLEHEARHDGLVVRTVEAGEAAGFGDLDTARAAVLPLQRRTALETLLTERSAADSRARAVLVEVGELAGELAGASALADAVLSSAIALRGAEDAAAAATRTTHLADARLTALTGHRTRLVEVLEDWAPLRDASLRASSMSRLVRGMGGDNQLQMRLSAYVLAQRLDQVVAAANERLGHMRDQRYLLRRTGRAARKGAQAGLGLEVVDQWTGDVRDPATLSGGETFVVSLSLALGLSDVVTQEAGGTEISTLFVDEGFGTLDADTLDDVMDRLDGLRAGGRTVGVVSHVSELRTRIPTQVHVDKGRSGSTVGTATLVG